MINIENCIIESAKGTKGFLIYTMNDEYVFRVYKEDHTFTDYDILHCDLELTIMDEDATFYEFKDGRNILDHSFEISNIGAGEDRNSVIVTEYDVGTEEGYKEFVKQRDKE